MVWISNKIDDYDLGIVSTLGGLWEPGSGEIQVFPPFWGIKEDYLEKNAFQLRSEESIGNNILQCGSGGEGEHCRQKTQPEKRLEGEKTCCIWECQVQ